MSLESSFDFALTGSEERLLFAAGIRQFQAETVFDAGMLLMRIGAVSTSFRDFYLPDETKLYGLKLWNMQVPLYDSIYTGLCDVTSYQKEFQDIHFQTAMIFDIRRFMQEGDYLDLWEWIIQKADYIFTDDKLMQGFAGYASSAFSMGEKEFYIIKTN